MTAKKMLCPGCGVHNMREATRFEVEIDTCMNCFGIWFDANEMIDYVKGRENMAMASQPPQEPFEVLAGSVPTPCPRCETRTLERGLAGRLDMSCCTSCSGVYLPSNTHKQIFSSQMLQRKSPSPIIEHNTADSRWDPLGVEAGAILAEVVASIFS